MYEKITAENCASISDVAAFCADAGANGLIDDPENTLCADIGCDTSTCCKIPDHNQGLNFAVVSGSCTFDANNCLTDGSGNYNYASSESCSIGVLNGGVLTATEFDTESRYDYLTINGITYSGSDGPNNINVAAGSTISWASDTGINRAGWTICIGGSPEQSGVGDGDELVVLGPIIGGACGAVFVFAMAGLCLGSYFKKSKIKTNARILQQQQKLQREQEQEVIRLRKQEDAKLQQEKERLLEQEMNSIDDKFELPSFDHKIDLPSFDNGLYSPVAGLPNVPSNIPSLPPPATNTFYPPPADFHMPPPPPLTGHVGGSDLPPGYASALILSQSPPTIVIPAPAAPPEATQFCVHCGKGVRPGSMFCIGCGKRL